MRDLKLSDQDNFVDSPRPVEAPDWHVIICPKSMGSAGSIGWTGMPSVKRKDDVNSVPCQGTDGPARVVYPCCREASRLGKTSIERHIRIHLHITYTHIYLTHILRLKHTHSGL